MRQAEVEEKMSPVDFRVLWIVIVRFKVGLHGVLLFSGELMRHLRTLKVAALQLTPS
jgi:hypothetical protein